MTAALLAVVMMIPRLVSIRNGKIKKRVCSEKCREQFEDRIWQQIADTNTKRRRQR